jgi:hypothetical protein
VEAPLRSRKPADRLSSRVSADPDVPSFQGIFYRSRVAVKSLDAGIQNFCGCEIGALTLQYALIAAGIATAIIALVSGAPI